MRPGHEWPLWLTMLQGEPQALESLREYLEVQIAKIRHDVTSRVLDQQAYAMQVGRVEALRGLENLLTWSKEDHDATERGSESRINGRSAH